MRIFSQRVSNKRSGARMKRIIEIYVTKLSRIIRSFSDSLKYVRLPINTRPNLPQMFIIINRRFLQIYFPKLSVFCRFVLRHFNWNRISGKSQISGNLCIPSMICADFSFPAAAPLYAGYRQCVNTKCLPRVQAV